MELKYTYRLAKPEDVSKIVDFVNKSEYFCSLDEHVGGQWALAENAEGIKAVAWFFTQAPHAYIDYWVGDRVAATLLTLFLHQQLKDLGVKYVRAMIAASNKSSIRVARSIGAQIADQYCLMYKEL